MRRLQREMEGAMASSGRYVDEKVDGIATGRKVWQPDNAPVVADAIHLTVSDKLEWNIATTMLKVYDLFRQRQAKYGPKNIAEFGERGIVVRLFDKLARLRNYYFDGGAEDMGDESVVDAWMDVACYAVIALVCRVGSWPGATPAGPDGRVTRKDAP